MNLAQAQTIAEQYAELINSIDSAKIQMPHKAWPNQNWQLSNLNDIMIEDGQLKFTWTYYSCGEMDHDTTYQSLSDFFAEGESK